LTDHLLSSLHFRSPSPLPLGSGIYSRENVEEHLVAQTEVASE
jgi:hypothetical protein